MFQDQQFDGMADAREDERFPLAESVTAVAQSAPEMEYHCIGCGAALEVGECQPCNACITTAYESDRPINGRFYSVCC